MFDYRKVSEKAAAAVLAIVLSVVSVGAAGGPARAVETGGALYASAPPAPAPAWDDPRARRQAGSDPAAARRPAPPRSASRPARPAPGRCRFRFHGVPDEHLFPHPRHRRRQFLGPSR